MHGSPPRDSNILHRAEINVYPYCAYFFMCLREILYRRSLLSVAEKCDFVKFVALKDMLLLITELNFALIYTVCAVFIKCGKVFHNS
jgi:hypothetical protein